MNVAIIGTQGVPASYGGFESLVENLIGEKVSEDIQYTVFCSGRDLKQKYRYYKGAHLKYAPLSANGMQSIPYDIISMMRCFRGYDVILVLGVSGCIFLPVLKFFCRSKIIVNIDGLEHRRDKWGRVAKWFLRLSEALAVRYANIIVSDNKGIQDYVTEIYGKRSEMIAYGGDHVLRAVPEATQMEILEKYGLCSNEYAVTVCRIEPENNCHITLEAFAESGRKLVFIGNWDRSEYGHELKNKYGGCPNIEILDPIYDLDILFTLRSNCFAYIHGHSAGGTNPSLVEAMFFGKPILCFDVVYNRETTKGRAYYFRNSIELLNILSSDNLDGSVMVKIASSEYTWKHISAQYENIFL